MRSLTKRVECGFNDLKSYGQQMVIKIQNSFIAEPLKGKERTPSEKLEMNLAIGLQILSKYLNA